MAFVRTVLGDIDPSQLGLTHMHEHLITNPPPGMLDDDFTMDSEEAALAELTSLREVGGQTLVEMTPNDYGRSPEALRRLAEARGVNVVMVTGFMKEQLCAPHVGQLSINQIADIMIRDVLEAEVKAGVIKAASSLNEITANEEKVIRAAARASLETGALISTHTEAGTMCLEQVALFREEGVSPERILIGHVDRNLNWEMIHALANTGVAMGFDQISKTKYYPDDRRLDLIVQLAEAGFEKQVAISCDLGRKSNRISYGGTPGLRYLLAEFVPMMEERGLNVDVFLRETPMRLLPIQK